VVEKIKKRRLQWDRWRGKDYQSQLYTDMWMEREAVGGRGKSRWTMSGKT